MMRRQENGPGAAATAHGAGNVALGKPTGLDTANPQYQQTPIASSMPDNTGWKQAAQVRLRVSRPSLRTAIDAMCRSCIYDPEWGNGTWREQVQGCSSANCPLHAVRPITVKTQNASKEARREAASLVGAPAAREQPRGGELGSHDLILEQRPAA